MVDLSFTKYPKMKGIRFNRRDDSYSHEKLYDKTIKYGDYINIPRGRIIWDIEKERSIIYIDPCIEEVPDAINELASIFRLEIFDIEHDEHYVCPKCMKDIW